MTKIFSIPQGLLLIGGYFIIIMIITKLFVKSEVINKKYFIVANRSLEKWETAFSISATWIWAPALFIAAQKAYTQGIAGLFWFTIPNILCLIIFSYFAIRVREKMPHGFTLSEYIKTQYSNRVQNLYLIELFGLGICSFAVQLLAGSAVISALTGIPFFVLSLIMALIAITYSLFYGLKASIVTDYFQMILIVLVGSSLVLWTIIKSGGLSTIAKGLGGQSGSFNTIFSGDALSVAYSFGIPVTIGLLAGPFGDQSFWQRAFSVKKQHLKSAFLWGACIFAIVPIMMSLFGFIAAGSMIPISNISHVNIETIIFYLPTWTVIPFTYVLMSGLISTLDSNICSLSSLAGHDIVSKSKRKKVTTHGQEVIFSRYSMIIVTLVAIIVANIPNLKILHLFLFYGTLRATTLLPTILTILGIHMTETGMFWGILIAIVTGLPLFAYGKLSNNTDLFVFASLFTVFSSAIISKGISIIQK